MRQVILGISESPRAFCSPCRKISGLDRPSAVMLSKVRTRAHREAVLCYSMPRTTCSRLVNGHLHRYRKNNYWNVIVVSSPVPPVQGDDVKLHFVSILILGDFPLFTKRPGIVNLLFSSEVKLPWNILLLSESERGNALNSVPFMKRIQMIDLCSSASNSLTLFCHWNQEEWRNIGQSRSSSFFPRLLYYRLWFLPSLHSHSSVGAYLSVPIFSICSTGKIDHIHWSASAC